MFYVYFMLKKPVKHKIIFRTIQERFYYDDDKISFIVVLPITKIFRSNGYLT